METCGILLFLNFEYDKENTDKKSIAKRKAGLNPAFQFYEFERRLLSGSFRLLTSFHFLFQVGQSAQITQRRFLYLRIDCFHSL